MPLGADVGLGRGNTVLDGEDPAPPTERGTAAPHFTALFALTQSPISATAAPLFNRVSGFVCCVFGRCSLFPERPKLSRVLHLLGRSCSGLESQPEKVNNNNPSVLPGKPG